MAASSAARLDGLFNLRKAYGWIWVSGSSDDGQVKVQVTVRRGSNLKKSYELDVGGRETCLKLVLLHIRLANNSDILSQ